MRRFGSTMFEKFERRTWRSGRVLWQLILLIPVLVSLYLLGFLSADLFASTRPGESMGLLRSTVSHLLQRSESKLDPVEAFQSALAEIEAHFYSTPPSVEKMTYAAIDGMLLALGDPYTRFMEPEEFRRMQEDTSGSFTGIGALLEDAPGGARVVRPLPNSPASRAGLKAGDIIIAVDGKSLEKVALDEAVRMIRGPRFTKVTLTIRREGEPNPLTITIQRDLVESPTVDVYLDDAENKIFRIWLQNFSEKAPQLLDRALSEIKRDGARALILDLRTNPGGLLESAIEVASRFLPEDSLVVSIKGRTSILENRRALPGRYRHLKIPMVVLINSSSASASEIVAGALRDHKVALLIGEPSYGKGLVQTVIPTSSNTAVAITTAKYLTPNGTDLNAKIVDGKRVGGLKPDIEVKQSEDWRPGDEDISKDLVLQKALAVLREKLQAASGGEGALRARLPEQESRQPSMLR
ncbi:MAG: S41 family peptidase [Armatimonadota bacterium]